MDLSPSHLVAFPRQSLAALRGALARDTGANFATYLQEAGYAGGEAIYAAFRTWLETRGAPAPESLDLPAYQARAAEFFQENGWGTFGVSAISDVVAVVESADWAESDPSSAMQYPACHYTTGLLADFFGRTAAAPLAVLEVACRSAGSAHCRFLVGSAEVMGHLYERMAAGESYEAVARALA